MCCARLLGEIEPGSDRTATEEPGTTEGESEREGWREGKLTGACIIWDISDRAC